MSICSLGAHPARTGSRRRGSRSQKFSNIGKTEGPTRSLLIRFREHLNEKDKDPKLVQIEREGSLESIWLGVPQNFPNMVPSASDIEATEALLNHGLDPWKNKIGADTPPQYDAVLYNKFNRALWQKEITNLETGRKERRPKWRPHVLPDLIEYTAPTALKRESSMTLMWASDDDDRPKPSVHTVRGKGEMLSVRRK